MWPVNPTTQEIGDLRKATAETVFFFFFFLCFERALMPPLGSRASHRRKDKASDNLGALCSGSYKGRCANST